jgi:hypothetical protein
MTTTYWIILIIIAFINGYHTQNAMYDVRHSKSRWVYYATFIFFALFGMFIFLFVLLLGVLKKVWDWFAELTQIVFWFRWLISGYYKNLDDKKLDDINTFSRRFAGDKIAKGQKMKLRDWHWLYCLKLISKRYPHKRWAWMFEKKNFLSLILIALLFCSCNDTRSFESARMIKTGMSITEVEKYMGSY